jgi:hypothetical protein
MQAALKEVREGGKLAALSTVVNLTYSYPRGVTTSHILTFLLIFAEINALYIHLRGRTEASSFTSHWTTGHTSLTTESKYGCKEFITPNCKFPTGLQHCLINK